MLRYLHLGPVCLLQLHNVNRAHNHFFKSLLKDLHKEVFMMGGEKFAPKNQLAFYLFQQLFFREYK